MKIAVIGHTCSGKSALTERLAELHPDHKVFHTDDYRPINFERALDPIMSDIINCGNPNIICEGVHTFRVLRKGAETRSLFFDAVIECHTDEPTQMSRYTSERDASTWQYIPSFNKSLDTIYTDYKGIVWALRKEPVFLKWKT